MTYKITLHTFKVTFHVASLLHIRSFRTWLRRQSIAFVSSGPKSVWGDHNTFSLCIPDYKVNDMHEELRNRCAKIEEIKATPNNESSKTGIQSQ